MQFRTDRLTERLYVFGCSIGIAAGLVATAGMLLAAATFATATSFVIPFIATFDGFHDAGGANAVTITGSWALAGAVTVILAGILSLFILRRFVSSPDGDAQP